MQNPSIIVKDLSIKNQDNFILDGISFSLQQGENLAILGSSGSGKTSLAKALAGKIHYLGTIENKFFDDGFNSSRIIYEAARNTFKNLSNTTDFYYQQRFNSFDAEDAWLVFDELVAALPEGDEPAKIKKVNAGLRKLGIEYLKNAALIQLSGGEQKRFQLLHALLQNPELLILDDPFTALDADARKGLNELLLEVSGAGTQLIVIPGTFPIPDCITHVLKLGKGKAIFFGKKEVMPSVDQDKDILQQPIINLSSLSALQQNFHRRTIVKMENVSIRYGEKKVVEKFNWQIKEGEKWLLKGKNGSGKSSLLSLICGDHPQAYANDIWLFGKQRGTGESIWDIKKKIGYVSLELHAFYDKNISCYNTIGSGFFDTIGLYKKLTTIRHEKILHWMDFLHLTSSACHKPLYEFSTGVQRMILLVRALVKDPPLLILDEPCQGLDFEQKARFISLVNEVCAERNKTLIYVTHDEEEIPGCIDNVLELKEGRQTIFKKNFEKLEELFF